MTTLKECPLCKKNTLAYRCPKCETVQCGNCKKLGHNPCVKCGAILKQI